MDIYSIIKFLHIIAVVGLVGPLFLVPHWLNLSQEKTAREMLHNLHFQTGLSGWIVLLTGFILIYLQSGFLNLFWIQVSIALYLVTQLFDHFWADKCEEKVENGDTQSIFRLKIWIVLKNIIYVAIAFFMVIKQP